MAERTARSFTLVRHIRWKLHIVGHHDAAHSTFLAGTWRTSSAEDRAHALARLAWDARDRPLPRSEAGAALTLATRLRRNAREHDGQGSGPFMIAPDRTADPVVQMRAAVLLAHAASRDRRYGT
ncbi:hypothetical protein ACH4LN_05555 [Streptomyces albus]|uniref:Uncharacterized protein n=1 Tax=Streptomyces albus TaxID=1888 RepID=A0A6C1C776_9ACTN|nr:hypothetical protein [Streptomyces albus]QID37412.1 hypothetical protein G3260_003839 [Streptomyces albus]TGG77724.1 hypothetical protein D8771_27090 [Streptomyces albus]UVN55612.1 hypothetical protein NR995_14565 [Streptomyces albus]GHJ23390.1 hypothetical protein TPA0909_50040 [Streptomyces albus]